MVFILKCEICEKRFKRNKLPRIKGWEENKFCNECKKKIKQKGEIKNGNF